MNRLHVSSLRIGKASFSKAGTGDKFENQTSLASHTPLSESHRSLTILAIQQKISAEDLLILFL